MYVIVHALSSCMACYQLFGNVLDCVNHSLRFIYIYLSFFTINFSLAKYYIFRLTILRMLLCRYLFVFLSVFFHVPDHIHTHRYAGDASAHTFCRKTPTHLYTVRKCTWRLMQRNRGRGRVSHPVSLL